MKGMTAFACMSDIREHLIEESLELFEQKTAAPVPKPQSAFSRFINSGWGVAAVCALVSVFVMGGIIWAGFNPPSGRPDDTSSETQGENIIETETETEIEVPRDPTAYTEGLKFEIDKLNKKASVRYYVGDEKDVVIPSYYEGNPVWKIKRSAFTGNYNKPHHKVNPYFESVYIPNTVWYIGDHAFYGCKNLKSIHIPASVTVIEEKAFAGCSSLTSITVDEHNRAYRAEGNCLIEIDTGRVIAACNDSVIPDDGTVKQIGAEAFSGCTRMTEIHIPSSVKVIEERAFFYCSSLVRVTGAEGVAEIGLGAFEECASLAEFPFHQELKVIGVDAFRYCQSLTKIRLPDRMSKLLTRAFEECDGLIEVILPTQVEDMGGILFSGARKLKSITIPEGYTHLNDALRGSALEEVHLPSTLVQVNNTDFVGCGSLRDIYYNGTKAQWQAIAPDYGVEYCQLHCLDGDSFWKFDSTSGVMVEVSPPIE